MWIFANTGFVAIAKFNPDRNGAEEFLRLNGLEKSIWDHLWLVRARREKDLDAFLEELPGEYRNPIIKMPSADYEYRYLITGMAMLRGISHMVRNIDYDSLKKDVAARGDRDYYATLNAVWVETLAGLDERGMDNPVIRPIDSRDAILFDEEDWDA